MSDAIPEAPQGADLGELASRLGHDFRDPALLRCALTHASATRGPAGDLLSYERLEFLGDRVLGVIVAKLLFERFPAEPEGDLARRLAALVRKETLAQVAAGLLDGEPDATGRSTRSGGMHLHPALLEVHVEQRTQRAWRGAASRGLDDHSVAARPGEHGGREVL